MPFTISHAVAVLPLTSARWRRWLVPSALVIGAMIPDWPYFFPSFADAGSTHAATGRSQCR